MESRILLYGTEARTKLKAGIDALADMVKVTLGPKGRNVIIEKKYGGPLITKDGVTVAREIFLKDPVENMGAQLLKEAASKTADIAGDGTTTATVLAQAIIQEGIKNVTAGANPMDLKRGIDIGTKAVVRKLKSISKEVKEKEEIVQIGTISANGDREIGQLIADAMEKVGNEGIITVEDSKSLETSVEVVDGMEFDRGYLSPYFITKMDSMEAVLTDVRILLYEKRLVDIRDLIPIMEKVARDGLSLLVVADDVEGDALKTLVFNRVKGIIKTCAVKAPGFGDRRKDVLQDIAVLTGGEVVTDDMGVLLKNVTVDDLGVAEKVIISRDKTTIIGGNGNKAKIEERAQQIKTQLEACESDFDKQKFQERLAKLGGGVGVLRVGAATEAELKEKKMRIEDALHATRAAVNEGIVPGGGIALVRTLSVLDGLKVDNEDQQIGVNIIKRSIIRPLISIVENAGVSGEVVLSNILNKTPYSYGYNAQTGEYEDLFKTGVIDPTKVVRVALENASSIAGLFLTTEGSISESLEEKAEFEKLAQQDHSM